VRQRDWISIVSASVGVTTAIFAVGGASRWSQAVVAGCAAVAIGAQLLSRRRLGRTSPLILALAIAAGLTALSLVPMPSAIRELLDPTGAALREDGTSLLDLAPWPGLTRDAPSSLRSLIFFVTLLGYSVIALRLAASERGRHRLLAGVAVLCGLTAIVSGIHELFGIKQLYGFYETRARPNLLGPLLNENHLGGLMAMGTCVAIGLALYKRQPSWLRTVWIVTVMICGSATAASNSRGAMIALLAGVVVTAALLLGQRLTSRDDRKRKAPFVTTSLPMAIVGICVIVLVVYASAGSISAKFDNTTSAEVSLPRSKFAAWRSAEKLVEESPWVGVGRGALESSFSRVHPASGAVTFAFLENEYLEAIVDWGIPGALLLAAALAWLATVVARRWRDSTLAAGSIGAITAIAIQSNVDFGIEMLGVAVPLIAIAATVTYVPLREDAQAAPKTRLLRAVTVLGLALAVVLLFTRSTTSIGEDHDDLHDGASLDEIRAELQRHPLDYYGYALASEQLRAKDYAKSIRLLNHAMELHPTHPDLHRVAAHLLVKSGHPSQAAVEYAGTLRWTQDPERVLAEITSTFSAPLAAQAIPLDFANPDLIVRTLGELKHDDVATLWLAKILEIHPRDVHACNQLYELSLSRGDLQAAEIAGKSCVEIMPDHQTRMSLAGVLLKRSKYREAIKLLDDVDTWHGLLEEKATAWLMLCDAYVGLEQWEPAASCLHHLDAADVVAADHHGEIAKRLDEIQQRRGAGSGSAD